MREFVIKWGLPTVAFLLPWQTRWIFYETLLGGQPFSIGASVGVNADKITVYTRTSEMVTPLDSGYTTWGP